MLIINDIPAMRNHLKAITDCFQSAKEAKLAVAYIQQSGVTILREYLARIGCHTRFICSLDMDITDPLAVKSLMDMGVAVKVYKAARGTLHTKLWLFKDALGCWECVIGSANLSASGLLSNIEVSVHLNEVEHRDALVDALHIFDFLWRSDHCEKLTNTDIDTWISVRKERNKMNSRVHRIQERGKSGAQVKILREFVKNWIDIGVDAQTEGANITGRLWRGWYIIPDQGYIDDALMNRLHRICQIMHRAADMSIDISEPAKPPFDAILKITEEKLLRSKRKMPVRSLFVRQEKNYLTHFDFAQHPVKPNGKPDKKILELTEYGAQFALSGDVQDQKKIYTASMHQYTYNGLHLLEFMHQLLKEVGKVDLTEFSLFANHAYSIGEVSNIAALIKIYRGLSSKKKTDFERGVDKYFKANLEHTATNVRGNYDKKTKHTMSALGWCEELYCDIDNWKLSLRKDS